MIILSSGLFVSLNLLYIDFTIDWCLWLIDLVIDWLLLNREGSGPACLMDAALTGTPLQLWSKLVDGNNNNNNKNNNQ